MSFPELSFIGLFSFLRLWFRTPRGRHQYEITSMYVLTSVPTKSNGVFLEQLRFVKFK